jgi:hypothetical protein
VKSAMPEAIEKAKRDKRQGKSPTTQAGEFVHEQIEKIRRGEHGARSARQAIAIGLSEARRAGVDLPPPAKGKTSSRTRKSAKYAYEVGQHKRTPKRRPRISRAVKKVLKQEPRSAASHKALARQARGDGKYSGGGFRLCFATHISTPPGERAGRFRTPSIIAVPRRGGGFTPLHTR